MDQFQKQDINLSGQGKSRQPGGQARVLVAPLDWGLGHATRCIPIIHELLKQGCEVYLCGEGAQEVLLKKEFPSLPFLQLQGYRVVYGRSAIQLLSNIFFQAPRIIGLIRNENAWLKKIVKEHTIDGVISDNRFGLHHDKIPCVFMTHQLLIKTRLGSWLERIVQKRNYHYINKFTECWVPDQKDHVSLAGELSQPKKFPKIPVKYIGILSRFDESNTATRTDHLFIILSGPEPQRSLLENKIIKEIGNYSATATVVRGLPGTETIIPSTNMIRFYNHLSTEELNQEILSADYVISRSGYTTVMDLVKLKKKSILIPTPGQPEQEYLGKYLEEKRIACCIAQKEFTLNTALQKARRFDYRELTINDSVLEIIISDFIKAVIKNKTQASSLG